MSMVLTAAWKHRPLTMQEYFYALRGFLGLIHAAHPELTPKGFYEAGSKPNDEFYVDISLHRLGEVVKKRSLNNSSDRAKNTYKYDTDGTVAWDCVSELGYGLMFTNGVKMGHGEVTFSARAGAASPHLNNAATIKFYDDFYPAARTLDAWWDFLRIVIHCWNPEYIRITSGDYKFMDKVKDKKLNEFSVNWITYLSNPKVLEIKDDSIPLQPFGTGALITLSPTPPDPEDAALVARAIHIRDALRAHGLLKYRTPDAAEDALSKDGVSGINVVVMPKQ